MTPQKKAANLVKEYLTIFGDIDKEDNFNKSIRCAAISVQEIIELNVWNWSNEEELRYWEKVKKALEKL